MVKIKKVVFLITFLVLFSLFMGITPSLTSLHVHAYTPNYEDHTDITVRPITVDGLEPNSTYRVTFRYVAEVQYSVYSENGYVAAGWFDTRFLRRSGIQIDKRETISGTFSLTGYTGNARILTFEIELWAEADGGELYSYDMAVIDVAAEVEVHSIEKISNDGDNGGGGGGGGKKTKYSGLKVKAANEKGQQLYHVPISVSGYREGTYETPFLIFKKSSVDSSFSVILTAPQKFVFGSKIRYFINWSIRSLSSRQIRWYQNNTISVHVPDSTEYVATAYYGRYYYWYRLEVKSNIPALIKYRGNVGSGSKYTNFTLYRESPIDDGLTVVLEAPEQVFYNGTFWFFDKWIYKIPIYSKEKTLYDNVGKFSCPNQAANKGIVIAVYKRTARLIVESSPIDGVPIQIWYMDKYLVKSTNFILEDLNIGSTVSLQAPGRFLDGNREYLFSYWLVNGKRVNDELIEVLVNGDTKVVAFYSSNDNEVSGRVGTKGEWLIPGESINITLPYPGVYTIKVVPYYNISKGLVALVVAKNASKYAYVDLNDLTLTVKTPFTPKHGSIRISAKELRKYPVVTSGEYKGWYFLGASAWVPDIEDSSTDSYSDSFDNEKSVTYAVYNLTIIWRGSNISKPWECYLKIKPRKVKSWSKTIVITTIDFTVWSFYEREGVYVVWEAYYKYLPPPELNLSPKPPHQDVWFTLEYENNIIISQRLGRGSRYYGVSNNSVFSDAFLSYEYILRKYGLKHLVFKARVRWSGPLGSPVNVVPYSEEKDIPAVPLCMKLLEIEEKPLHLVFKWTLLNKTALPGYSRLFCPCVSIDVLTEWDGKLYENIGVKSEYDYTVYIVDLDIEISWPKRITVYFEHSRTENLILVIPSVRL